MGLAVMAVLAGLEAAAIMAGASFMSMSFMGVRFMGDAAMALGCACITLQSFFSWICQGWLRSYADMPDHASS